MSHVPAEWMLELSYNAGRAGIQRDSTCSTGDSIKKDDLKQNYYNVVKTIINHPPVITIDRWDSNQSPNG
jgi:hypothetical protein